MRHKKRQLSLSVKIFSCAFNRWLGASFVPSRSSPTKHIYGHFTVINSFHRVTFCPWIRPSTRRVRISFFSGVWNGIRRSVLSPLWPYKRESDNTNIWLGVRVLKVLSVDGVAIKVNIRTPCNVAGLLLLLPLLFFGNNITFWIRLA